MGVGLSLVAEVPKGFLFRKAFQIEEIAAGTLKCLPMGAGGFPVCSTAELRFSFSESI